MPMPRQVARIDGSDALVMHPHIPEDDEPPPPNNNPHPPPPPPTGAAARRGLSAVAQEVLVDPRHPGPLQSPFGRRRRYSPPPIPLAKRPEMHLT